MSSLKELENFSNLKHPIFKGLWIFSKPKEPSWSLSRLFEARIWASIQSLCIPGSIKRLVPPGRGNGPDLGWRKQGKEWDTHDWKREIGRGHVGKERGCLQKKKIRRQLWEYMCVLVLTLHLEHSFHFEKKIKRERIRSRNGWPFCWDTNSQYL